MRSTRRITRALRNVRRLHDGGVWGRAVHREYEADDFTPDELANRAASSSLVRLVDSYRRHAHRAAKLDPLGLAARPPVAALDPRRYGFALPDGYDLPEEFRSANLPPTLPALADPHKQWRTAGVLYGVGESATLVEVLERLQAVYAESVAIEHMHGSNKHEREFLSKTLEEAHVKPVTKEDRLRHFRLLAASAAFDAFCAKRFPSVKRYSLEGAESMIVALDHIFRHAADTGVEEAVLAMPHRGRLNLLVGLLDFDVGLLLHKMKGRSEISQTMLERGFTGDVLSHLHGSPTLEHYSRPLRCHLLPNPSHLEAVNPVGLGYARALQVPERAREPGYRIGDKVLSIQCHGDAAWAGQGVVAECLNMQTLPHYAVGGTIRLVVNNQVGFTAAATEGRSSFYATDLAKAIGAPIIHVNADKPDAVGRAVELACDYRKTFRKDVVIDLIAYRRWGHNELDEPAFTQPAMYGVVRKLKSPPQLYEDQLVSDGVLDVAEAKSYKDGIVASLDEQLGKLDSYVVKDPPMRDGWSAMTWPKTAESSPATGVDIGTLRRVGEASVAVPAGFSVHPSVDKRHIAKRLQAIETGKDLDFGTTEALAFGSLMLDGHHIRVSGQDSSRGTFSHRHAVLVDQETSALTVPLNEALDSEGRAEFVSSPLSEYAVVGFEQGVRCDCACAASD